MNTGLSRSRKAITTLAIGTLAAVLGARAAFAAQPAELVDALNGVFGEQTHGRAVHAKGLVLHGEFIPDEAAAALSAAPHFQGEPVPVTVRFSAFTGIPDIPDNDSHASPRGLAVKFGLPDGSFTDLVTHSINGFPTATAEEFRQLLLALAASGPDVASPTPIETYLAEHAAARAFFDVKQPPPVSYGTLAYFGVNSFRFTNAQGESVFGRYRIEPQAGERFLPEQAAADADPNYLAAEMRERIAQGPVRFDVRVQLAGPDDRIEDPSVAWPDSRETVELGVLEITAVDEDSNAAERELLFLPAALPEGIAPADPMIGVRHAAYPVSFSRRQR